MENLTTMTPNGCNGLCLRLGGILAVRSPTIESCCPGSQYSTSQVCMVQVPRISSVIYGLYRLTSLHLAICVKQILPSSLTRLVRINVSHKCWPAVPYT